jgi:hypothetical protein
MSSLVDFNVSTPRNKTQSSNECGVVINNTITNERKPTSKRASIPIGYPPIDITPSVTPTILTRDVTIDPPEVYEEPPENRVGNSVYTDVNNKPRDRFHLKPIWLFEASTFVM